MKLICWNVNGLRSIYKKGFLPFVKRHRPDVLCLQEVKMQEDQLSDETPIPKGYKALFSCAEKKGYSGVATFVREELLHSRQKVLRGIGIPEFDREGRFLIWCHRDFHLINAYFPSGTTGEIRQEFKYEFLEAVYAYLETLKPQERRKVILCGDFNICHRPIDIHHPDVAEKRALSGFLPDERAWMDRLVKLGFHDSFRHIHGEKPQQYTWWSFRAGARQKNLGWRIDYFFLSRSLRKRLLNASILSRVAGSDHCPIQIELSL